jgi:3-dehydroquinate synthase class II
MLLVEFHLESVDRAGTIFLQQAETVRFVAPTETVGGGGGRAGVGAGQERKAWRPLPVTEAKAGDAICVVLNELGTHIGQRIEAKVDET